VIDDIDDEIEQYEETINEEFILMEQLTVGTESHEVPQTLVIEGSGHELRTLLKEAGFVLRLGITNRTIESFAKKVLVEEYQNTLNQFTGDFVYKLGKELHGVGYIEIVEPKQPKQVENGVVSPTGSLLSNETETKQEEMEQVVKERNDRLSAKGRWVDSIDFSILLLRSAQWAFILVVIGVLGQAFHVYHVVENLSDLQGWARVANGLLWAVFLSFGLVYFSLKLGKVNMSEPSKVKKYKTTVAWFVGFDVFANLYYWAYRFVLLPGVLDNYMKEFIDNGTTYMAVDWQSVDWMTFELSKVQWPQMIAATVFAFAIPFILKAFAGEVDLPAKLDGVFRSYKEETLN